VHPPSESSSVLIEQSADDRKRRWLIVAGQIAFLPTGMLTTLLWPMLGILSARWGLTYEQSGILFPVQFLAQLAGVQLSGLLLSRAGFRPAFLSGLLLMAAGVGTLYLGSPWMGRVSVAVYGLGLGLIIPTDNLMIAEVSTGSRSAAVSLLNFFWGLGAVICSLLVAWAQSHHVLPLLLESIAAFLLLMAVVVRGLPFPTARKSTDPPVRWREIARNPATWLFACVFFLYPGTETAVGGWIGSYAAKMGSHGASIGAMMPALFLAALTVGRGAGGAVLHYVSERQILRVGYGMGTAGIAVLLWFPTLQGVIASAIITGLAFATLYPVTVARLSQRFGVEARSVGSIMFSIAAIGPAALPWLVGIISQSAGSLRAGLVVPLVATVVLFLIHLKDW
jgi:fucose permease